MYGLPTIAVSKRFTGDATLSTGFEALQGNFRRNGFANEGLIPSINNRPDPAKLKREAPSVPEASPRLYDGATTVSRECWSKTEIFGAVTRRDGVDSGAIEKTQTAIFSNPSIVTSGGVVPRSCRLRSCGCAVFLSTAGLPHTCGGGLDAYALAGRLGRRAVTGQTEKRSMAAPERSWQVPQTTRWRNILQFTMSASP
jgi:hypothetical protein